MIHRVKSILHHWFLPHHTNNHRAKALHVDSLFFYALFFALFYLSTGSIHQAIPSVLGYATDIYVDQLLSLTNSKRQSSGLGSLTLNAQLSQAAASKAQDMFAKGYWAHNSPDGKTPWDFFAGAGYKYSVAGENLAKNFNNSGGVVDAWMASPTHRDNILKSNYKEVGFAVVNGKLNGEETTLVVQMFGTPIGAVAQIQQNPKTKTQLSGNAQAMPLEVKAPVKEQSALVPTKTPTSVGLAQKPVEIPVVSVATEIPSVSSPLSQVASAFAGVSIHPIVDLDGLSKTLIYAFMGIMLIVFVVDAWLVYHRKIVRVAGHNIAHFFFFGALFILLNNAVRGSIL